MNKKLIFITMLIVSLALCFFSCELPQLSITVTDIPATYNGKYGYIGLTNNATESSKLKQVALSLPVTISGGQITCDLLDRNTAPFTETGTYHCVFMITTDSSGTNSIWSGAKLNLKLADPNTTIKFTQLTVVN